MFKRSAILLGLIAVAATAADAPVYKFNLTVRSGDNQTQHVVETLPAGAYRVVDVSPTLKFDLVAPTDGKSPTIVRLVDTSGADPKVLHTAQRGGPAGVLRESAYTVCKEGVYFESPTPEVSTSKCRD
jgi:hypothetical protein